MRRFRTVRRTLHERTEDGMAMVMTVAVIFLTAIVSTTLLATTIFTTSNTTATRANVQAVAAAEAGVEAVASTLRSGGACAGSYTSPAGPVEYAVKVEYKPAGVPTWSTGCPPPDVDALRITSTGTAATRGNAGNDRGDEAVVEMLLERPNPSPRFTKAIFGDLEMSIATALNVTPSDADLYTNGDYTCSSHTVVRGSVFAQGDATFSSAPCTVDGDVYVGGNFVCGGGLTIGGDLYVQGSIKLSSDSCKVNGSLWSGGNTQIPNGGTPIGGDLFVRGNLDISGVPSIGGLTKVRGSVTTSFWSSQFMATYPSTVQPDTTLGFPPGIPPSPDNTFPRLTKADPLWDGFDDKSWRAATEPYRPASWINVCSMWGGPWTTPVRVTTNSVFDVTKAGECSGGELLIGSGGFKMVLEADAVIFVNKFSFGGGGNMSVTSGDGDEHTLYIVHPWPASQVACPGPTAAPTIELTGSTWTQDDKTRAFFYSPRKIKINGSPTIRGQLYGCNVRADTSVTLKYAAAGGAATTPGLSGLDLEYIRDVTD